MFGRRQRVALVVWGLAIFGLSAIGGRFTYSAFSSTTSNSGNTFSAASSFSCSSPGTQAVTADADAYVKGDRPTSNTGTLDMLLVEAGSGSRWRPLVRFPLPAQPSGCTITSAKLRLNATASDGGRTIEAFQVASVWTETGVTWDNQPPTTGTASTATSALGWVEWQVTLQVQAMYAGSNYGFLLKDQAEGQSSSSFRQNYDSREATNSANRPQLLVTFG